MAEDNDGYGRQWDGARAQFSLYFSLRYLFFKEPSMSGDFIGRLGVVSVSASTLVR